MTSPDHLKLVQRERAQTGNQDDVQDQADQTAASDHELFVAVGQALGEQAMALPEFAARVSAGSTDFIVDTIRSMRDVNLVNESGISASLADRLFEDAKSASIYNNELNFLAQSKPLVARELMYRMIDRSVGTGQRPPDHVVTMITNMLKNVTGEMAPVSLRSRIAHKLAEIPNVQAQSLALDFAKDISKLRVKKEAMLAIALSISKTTADHNLLTVINSLVDEIDGDTSAQTYAGKAVNIAA